MVEVAERQLSNRDDCAYHVETVVLALGYLASALVLRRSWVVPAGYLYGGETRELEAVLPALGGACCCLDPLLEFNGKGLGMGDWGINRRSSRGYPLKYQFITAFNFFDTGHSLLQPSLDISLLLPLSILLLLLPLPPSNFILFFRNGFPVSLWIFLDCCASLRAPASTFA